MRVGSVEEVHSQKEVRVERHIPPRQRSQHRNLFTNPLRPFPPSPFPCPPFSDRTFLGFTRRRGRGGRWGWRGGQGGGGGSIDAHSEADLPRVMEPEGDLPPNQRLVSVVRRVKGVGTVEGVECVQGLGFGVQG